MRLIFRAVVLLTAMGLLLACGHSTTRRMADGPGAPAGPPSSSAPGGAGRSAPSQTFAVGVRMLDLSRSADRPLPTTVWYPATGPATSGGARADAPVAAGRFPLVLASHGLTSLPQDLAGVTTRLAAAGFVIAAPAYPHTNRNAANPNVADVLGQPADAFFVIDAVLKLNERSGDPLRGHLDPERIAAAGHSAGGFTTAGMLAAKHDARIRAGVIIAGGGMGAFTTPSASMLFVHGDQDEVVAYTTGRSAYERLAWPKAFLTVIGGDHSAFLAPASASFGPVLKTVTDFLRSTLYDDPAARSRLPTDGTSAVTRYEERLG